MSGEAAHGASGGLGGEGAQTKSGPCAFHAASHWRRGAFAPAACGGSSQRTSGGLEPGLGASG